MAKLSLDRWYQWVDQRPTQVVLDGGLGSILSERGNSLSEGSLWSGRLLVTDPAELRKVAELWLEAGADVVVTATYQVSIAALRSEFGMSEADAQKTFRSAVQLLSETVTGFWTKLPESEQKHRRRPVVGVSFGPYSAILPNTTEYLGTYEGVSHDEMERFHRDRCSVLESANDLSFVLYCFETIGNVDETRAIVTLMSEKEREDIPYWISFQCKDGEHIACGEKLSTTIRMLLSSCSKRNLIAVGVNCISPQHVGNLVEIVRKTTREHMERPDVSAWRVDSLAYPNSGEIWSGNDWAWPKEYSDHGSQHWAEITRNTGARLVGGCCRIGPDAIRFLCEGTKKEVFYEGGTSKLH